MTAQARPACWTVLTRQCTYGKPSGLFATDPTRIGVASWSSLEDGNRELWRLIGLQAHEDVFVHEIDLIRVRHGGPFWYRVTEPIVIVSMPTPLGDLRCGPSGPCVHLVTHEEPVKKLPKPSFGGASPLLAIISLPEQLRKEGAPIFEWAETILLG